MIATLLLLVTAACLAGTFLISKIHRKRRPGEPPVAAGNWLWGNASEFSTNAVDFFLKCKKSYGDIFTIRMLNQYMTIIMDPHSYEAMTKERAFDFDPIQKQVNTNVFGFELKESRTMFKNVGKTVRGQSMVRAMKNFSEMLDESLENVLDNNNESDWHDDGLRRLTSKTMFTAIFHSIFGRATEDKFTSENVCKNFDLFHQYFNYLWLGLPHKLFPEATKALNNLVVQPSAEEFIEREDTSDYIKQAIQFMKENDQSESDIVCHSLVYLHVNYNTFKVAFWCLYYVLTHPEAEKELRRELEATLESCSSSDDVTEEVKINQATLENMPVLGSIIQESFRLSSGVFMVRQVTKDTTFTMDDGSQHLIRKGDKVAIYPPAIHRDGEIYEEPTVFKWDRFMDDAKFYNKNKEIKNPIMAYGSLCPGKRYSLLQVRYFLVSMFAAFDMVLKPGQTTDVDNKYYGHEILPPLSDVDIKYTVREKRRTLRYE